MRSFIILSKKFILSRVSQEELFSHYFGIFKTNMLYKNPLRNDKNTTCNFFYHYDGTLFFKDPAWTNKFPTKGCFNVFTFIQHKFSQLSHYEVLQMICNDFNLSNTKAKYEFPKLEFKNEHSYLPIRIRTKSFTKESLDFWNLKDFTFTEKLLNYYNVYFVDCAFLGKDLLCDNQQFTFAYYLKSPDIFQLYKPKQLDRTKRFRCNNVKNIYGLHHLRKGYKHIILTKSYKDFLYLQIAGFNVCCVLSENLLLNMQQVNQLKQWGELVLFYDNDLVGETFSKLRSEEYSCKYILLPDKSQKDFSDFVKTNSLKEGINQINQLLNDL